MILIGRKTQLFDLLVKFTAVQFLIWLSVQPFGAQTQQTTKFLVSSESRTLQANIEKFIAPYVQMQDLSGAILVSQNGRVLSKTSFGYADFDARRQNTEQTRFRIGSLNKQLTAAAILLLEEQKKLATNDPVSKFFPNFPNGEQITIERLLTHKSGLPKYVPLADENRQPPAKELLKIIASLQPEAKPGERFNYSNAGFVLLALIIEKTAGKTFPQFLAENVFKPLGMKSSGIGENRELARGYVTDVGTKIIPAPALDVFNYEVFSTAEDLDKWQTGLYGGKLLSAPSLTKMTNDYGDRYGYGLSVRKSPRRSFGHDGITSGYNGFVTYFPDENLSIVYLGNIESGALSELQSNLPAIASGGQVKIAAVRDAPAKTDTGKFKDFVGRYEVFPGFYLDVKFENEKLSLRGPLGAFIALTPTAENRFFYRHLFANVAFARDENGKVVKLDWVDASGSTYPCKKIGSTY